MPESDPDASELREGWRAIHRRLLRHSDLKLAEKEVLRNLLDRMGRGNICFPSQATIAWDCNLSRGHVNESLKGLCARGFITKLPRQRRQSLSYRMNTRALLDWSETEPEEYPLEAIAEQDILTVGISDDKVLLSDNLTQPVRLSDSTCQNFLHPEVIPVSESQEVNLVATSPAPRGKKPSVMDTVVETVRQEFLGTPRLEEMLLLSKSSPVFKFAAPADKLEVLRVLLRQRIQGFSTPRSAAGTGTQPSSAALHNPIPKNGFEDEKAEALAKFKAARAKGYA